MQWQEEKKTTTTERRDKETTELHDKWNNHCMLNKSLVAIKMIIMNMENTTLVSSIWSILSHSLGSVWRLKFNRCIGHNKLTALFSATKTIKMVSLLTAKARFDESRWNERRKNREKTDYKCQQKHSRYSPTGCFINRSPESIHLAASEWVQQTNKHRESFMMFKRCNRNRFLRVSRRYISQNNATHWWIHSRLHRQQIATRIAQTHTHRMLEHKFKITRYER